MSDFKKKYAGFDQFTTDTIKAERERQTRVQEARAKQNANGGLTNEVFAATNPEFREACEKAGIQPTGRQAGKFRRKVGKAYKRTQGGRK